MNTTIKPELERERKIWLVCNPGIVNQISRKVGVTPAMVYMVLKGRRQSPRIAAALAAAGAPGFQESSHGKRSTKSRPKKTSSSATR